MGLRQYIAILAGVLTFTAAQSSPAFFGRVLADWDGAWKYEPAITNLATYNWTEASFDDSTWPIGQGPLGYPFTERLPSLMTNRTELPPAQGRLTQYFRTTFEWDRPESVYLTFSNFVDDGAVFYLNGQEIGRIRMPEGQVDGNTLAAFNWEVVNGYDVFVVESPPLVQGPNLLAVEVHQSTPASADLIFGCHVRADQSRPPCGWLPTQRFSLTLHECVTTNLAVSIEGYPRPALQWFKDDVEIPDATNAVYVLENIRAQDEGVYTCREFTELGQCDSAEFTVTVIFDPVQPYVQEVVGLLALTNIHVRFSHPMDRSTAEDVFSYWMPDLTVEAAILDSTGREVTLVTEPRRPGVFYDIEISGIMGATNACEAFGNLVVPIQRKIDLQTVLLPFGSSWRYHDQGTDLGTSWTGLDYDDTGWQIGPAMLGAEFSPSTLEPLAAAGLPQQTVLNTSFGPGGFPMTYYFRARFTLPLPVRSMAVLRHVVDDGSVFHLNGGEAGRFNMPSGPVAYNTTASQAIEAMIVSQPTTGLLEGTNVLAVEVHQSSTSGGDILFAASIIGVVEAESVPALHIRRNQAGEIVLSWSGIGVLEEAPALPATWSPSPNQSNPQVLSNPIATRFYRVRFGSDLE